VTEREPQAEQRRRRMNRGQGRRPVGNRPANEQSVFSPRRAIIIVDLAATRAIVPVPITARVLWRPFELLLRQGGAVPLWSAETTVDEKMTATLVGPIDVLPAQSATPPGLRPALGLLLETVLARHTRLRAPVYPDRWGHGCHAPSISHGGRSDHGCEERGVDGTL